MKNSTGFHIMKVGNGWMVDLNDRSGISNLEDIYIFSTVGELTAWLEQYVTEELNKDGDTTEASKKNY